jgi:hypothetical protein
MKLLKKTLKFIGILLVVTTFTTLVSLAELMPVTTSLVPIFAQGVPTSQPALSITTPSTIPTTPKPGTTAQPMPYPPPTPIPTPPPSPVNSTMISAKIPNWVKGVFNLYSEGKISDNDLIQLLEFLIQQGIIKVG